MMLSSPYNLGRRRDRQTALRDTVRHVGATRGPMERLADIVPKRALADRPVLQSIRLSTLHRSSEGIGLSTLGLAMGVEAAAIWHWSLPVKASILAIERRL